MRKAHRILIGLHLFVGIGAMAGGLGAILSPNNPMGMTTEALKSSPFTNFLIPGIFLFVVIGMGNVLSAIALYRFKYGSYVSNVMSWILVLWIIVQCIMLDAINILHVIYFVIGIIEAILAFVILYNQRYFPTNILRRFIQSS
ncbi:hypothetical protein HZI73_20830 [Vallitalea pronyensis]|uniref:Uncharacterized protein n=1 Tax=Vallitalea pronyensis TaxID=1348613 RepID=A0A8J8SIK3_9FIRM|nr:hypothetical protein [Vallitalea pronyensis]QUI24598.1 hypothetical protein HZI73_20830 [Vallitalea pronyensis]